MFQSDLYAVGVVALVLLTGINPGYIRPTDTFTHPVVLDELAKEISPPLLEWFKESLAILPQNRFARAEEMREALLNLESKVTPSPTVIRKLGKGAKKEDYSPSSGVTIVRPPTGIITTQNEIDAFHAIRRIFQKAGLDPNRLQMKDTVEYCGINIDGDEKKTLIKLYFNDENNLSFSIVLANGKEENFSINTMRGIAPKKDQIISRAKELMTGAKAKPNPVNETGKTKYLFNGQQYGKGRLVLAVVTEYIRQNPKLTLVQLQEVFPEGLHGNCEIIEPLSFAQEKYERTGYKRFFMNPEDILRDGKNQQIVVTTQWGNNMENFLKKARELNFVIKEV